MRSIRLLIAVIFIVFFNVHVSEAAFCATVADVRRDVSLWQPPPALVEMNREETQAFLEVYNAMPPVSSYAGENSLVISDPAKRNILFVTFIANCANTTFTMPRAFFMSIVNGPIKGIKA